MKKIISIFSWKGKIGRKEFFVKMIIIWILFNIFKFLLIPLIALDTLNNLILLTICSIFFHYLYIVTIIKRLNDLNYKWYTTIIYYLPNFIPITIIYIISLLHLDKSLVSIILNPIKSGLLQGFLLLIAYLFILTLLLKKGLIDNNKEDTNLII
ncbi:MAG: hypothetical protein PHZ26_05380 [Candidatus Gracilibacteria bacterium]|nr:hypothetical protein [Candidatus Gracilibacteria bacterium]